MRDAHDEFDDQGLSVVAVATRADWQARQLVEDGYPFPLLLDPDDAIRAALGVARLDNRAAWDPRAVPAYARAWWKARRKGERHEAVMSEANNAPLTFVVDEELDLTWQYVGERIGDYPTLDDIRRGIESHRRRDQT